MNLPAGYVDPTDPAQVSDVIAAVVAVDGISGVFDLLRRLPGAQLQGGASGRFLRRTAQPAISLGEEHRFTLAGAALEHGHVVRGVVLLHERLQRGRIADSLGHVIAGYVADDGRLTDASAALTAVRDLAKPT